MNGGIIAAIVIGSYIVIAVVAVCCFPCRTRKGTTATLKKRFPYSLRSSAHRGGSLLSPENTLLAFYRAADCANDDRPSVTNEDGEPLLPRQCLLEMDVHLTKDGHVVVAHDDLLERIVDVYGEENRNTVFSKVHRERLADTTKPFEVAELQAFDPETGASALPQLRPRIALHFPSSTYKYYEKDGQYLRDAAAKMSSVVVPPVSPSSPAVGPAAYGTSLNESEVSSKSYIHLRHPIQFGSSVRGSPKTPKTNSNNKKDIQADSLRLTRMCLLREVFEAFPQNPIHLDVKAPSEQLTKQVVDLIDEFQRQTITIVGSAAANKAALQNAIRARRGDNTKRNPDDYRIFASFQSVGLTYFLFYIGLLPFIPLSYDVLSLPAPTTKKKELIQRFVGPRLGAFISWMLYSPTLWKHLQRRGIAVVGWVLNDLEEFHEAVTMPINSIMTDDPVGLRMFWDSYVPGNKSVATW